MSAPRGAPRDEARWVQILDRIEHRQEGVGLRFWGWPLWLEVTMTGPDSDGWATAGAGVGAGQSWDWQSSSPCVTAGEIIEAGGDDDQLLEAASRYCLENLFLNAAHEVGEWLRYDARRVFAAHRQRTGSVSYESVGHDPSLSGDGAQGNGEVSLDVAFDHHVRERPAQPATERAVRQLDERLARDVAAWRFSYLPGTEVFYDPDGPRLSEGSDRTEPDSGGWGIDWSESTVALRYSSTDELTGAVQADVHRMLLLREAERICDAFHVDDRSPWVLVVAGHHQLDSGRRPVTVSIRYEPSRTDLRLRSAS